MIEMHKLLSYTPPPIGEQLITTKLQIPGVLTRLVSRPSLTHRINNTEGNKLTLISAAAGFGKTTLLSEWASQSNLPVAWVSLDERDDQPDQFWLYVITALQMLSEGIGETALRMLYNEDAPPIEVTLTTLINDLALASSRLVLILDNYQLITSPDINAAMTFLLDHLPTQLWVIIASRTTPTLPLARLRGLGYLSEFQTQDLRFSTREIEILFNQIHKLDLEADELTSLEQRTEGWITALQLTVLAFNAPSGDCIASLTGTHRHIVDYFSEEIFDRQPQAVQDFLLKTSVATTLSADLCDAITAGTDSRTILNRLERDNLFTLLLDSSRLNYRYNTLFRDFLQGRLQACCDATTINELHRRATDWYQANGMTAEASHHSPHTYDVELSLRLSERELEVLGLIAQGFSNHQIASELIVAVSTVKTHVKSIYRKLDVNNRFEAIERVRELSLLTSARKSA